MSMNLSIHNNIISFLALAVLIIGSVATLYVHANQSQQNNEDEIIIINDQRLNINIIFDTYINTTIETDIGPKSGILLSDLLTSAEIQCPICHSYCIKSSDGYQQTVNWNDIEKGILTFEKRTYFPHLAHAFWVRDITEIKVKDI